jgi:hypothetical protein
LRRRQSASIPRLGPTPPLPFIGRARELDAVAAALERAGGVSIVGATGAGKTELAREVARRAGRPLAWVSGDSLEAVVGQAERALGALPDTLVEHVAARSCLLVIDDAHRLGVGAARLLERFGTGAGWVLALGEERLARGGVEIALDGLAVDDARALWMRLEESFGPTRQGACDAALSRTRGLPLALRREYARAVLDLDDPWDLAALGSDERRVLAALALLGPASAGALAALSGVEVEAALRALAQRQLASALPDGRFSAHETVAARARAALGGGEQLQMEERAATLVAGRAQAWPQVGGDAAPGDLCDRVLRAASHFLAAGQPGAAAHLLGENEDELVARGAGAELRALLPQLGDAAVALHVRVLTRTGRVAAARARCPRQGSHPELRLAAAHAALAAADLAAARAWLEPLGEDPRAGVVAALVELEAGRFASARARTNDARILDEIEARDSGAPRRGAALDHAEREARADERPLVADELRRRQARAVAAAGKLGEAERSLAGLAADARARGAELGALHAEADLAAVLLARGRTPAAAQLASDIAAEARARGLAALAAEAELVLAGADLESHRVTEAARAAAALMIDGEAAAWVRAAARRLATRAAAHLGEPVACDVEARHLTDLDDVLVAAEVAQLRSDPEGAIAILGHAAVLAERAGRAADLAAVEADSARLFHARGDRHAAACAAARALAEASAGGADRTVARALLVTAALAREDGDVVRARNAAADALAVARAAGGGMERYAAAAAAETLARLSQDPESAETMATVARAASATLSSAATIAADRLLADLGLSPRCAYRLIDADGGVSYAAKMDARRLGLERKELVVDGDAEVIVRRGERVADLRRRTLLKRLLFLFAGAPGRLFTKEEIVERVWGVEYHPLHHDAALFTNVMRLRRLLGDGGPDLLRVGEGGYLFAPPPDFIFIERLPV